MSTSVTSSPFTQRVVAAMRKLYPESLADKSFDNTGLLLEAPERDHLNATVLLTGDLTTAVANEAISSKHSIIVTYHPIIFRPLKALTLQNTQQSTLLRLAQEGISVYSPHTAVDATPLGLNDWLADVITGLTSSNKSTTDVPHVRSVIHPVKGDIPAGFEGAGYGKIVRFTEPQELSTIVRDIRLYLGDLSGLSVAVPQKVPIGERSALMVSSVGICAGSGGSMLGGLDVDLLFTGELSHHEALAATEQGRVVITAFHSNTERKFLSDVMRPLLSTELGGSDKDTVVVSQVDRDPFDIITKEQAISMWW